MNDIDLVEARTQLVFPGWGDAGKPRTLHMFGYYVIELAATFEKARTGTGKPSDFVDGMVDVGAAAWWALNRQSDQQWSANAITSAFNSHGGTMAGDWASQPAPLLTWFDGLMSHASAVLLAPATGMADEEHIIIANLVVVVGLAQQGAAWVNSGNLDTASFG